VLTDADRDPAWAPRDRPPRDPHDTWITDTFRLGPTRPCGHCGSPVRQAWWKGARPELLLYVEGPHDPAGVHPHWLAWWWNDRRPLQDRIARHDTEHLARGDLLFLMHPCEDPAYRPAPTAPPPNRKASPRMTTFGTPAPPGEGVKNDELVGHLLLITVTEKKTGVVTSNGPADVVVADVVELDTGAEHIGNFLFGRVLFGQLAAGVTYLGRIEKGVQQPGKSAPWIFTTAHEDPAAVQTAQQYLAYKASSAPAPAAAPAAPPAPSFPPAQAAAPATAAAPPWAQ
jgi:hypothetical protein